MRILFLTIFILTILQQKYRANAYPIRRKTQNRPVLNWNSKPFRKFSLSWALVAYLILKIFFRSYFASSKSRRTQRVKNKPLASDKTWSVTKVWMNKYHDFIMNFEGDSDDGDIVMSVTL